MIDHDLLQRRLNASTPPARPSWPRIAARFSAHGLTARDEARDVVALTASGDGSLFAVRACRVGRQRRRLTRDTWTAERRWWRRWQAWEDAYVDWRRFGGGTKADRLNHGGSKRDLKHAKAKRQARKKARAGR